MEHLLERMEVAAQGEGKGKGAEASSSHEPAEGDPSPGTQPAQVAPVEQLKEIMLLYGGTSKEKSMFRASVRADMKKKGIDRKLVKFKSSLKPAPPLCNRVASGWHKEPIPCYCHLWPPWLKEYTFPKSQLCRPINGGCEDFEGKTNEVKAGQRL